MTKESLEKAVLRLKAGEREAFDYIYDNTYKVVFFVVHNIVRQRETAEDIVQDTYITALRNIDSYSSNNLLAWLTTIAKRLALNSYNRGKRERITDFQEEGEGLCRGDMPDDDTIGLIKTAEKVLNDGKYQEKYNFSFLPAFTHVPEYSFALSFENNMQGSETLVVESNLADFIKTTVRYTRMYDVETGEYYLNVNVQQPPVNVDVEVRYERDEQGQIRHRYSVQAGFDWESFEDLFNGFHNRFGEHWYEG